MCVWVPPWGLNLRPRKKHVYIWFHIQYPILPPQKACVRIWDPMVPRSSIFSNYSPAGGGTNGGRPTYPDTKLFLIMCSIGYIVVCESDILDYFRNPARHTYFQTQNMPCGFIKSLLTNFRPLSGTMCHVKNNSASEHAKMKKPFTEINP